MVALTTKARIVRMFSDIGVAERTDDPTAAGAIDDSIKWASSTIAQHIMRNYDAEDVVNNDWVTSRATILACYHLSQRRGNPSLFSSLAALTMEELRAIMQGKAMIPDAPRARSNQPVLTNYDITPTARDKVSVDGPGSTGDNYPDRPLTDRDDTIPFYVR